MGSFVIIEDIDGHNVQVDPATRSLFVYLAAALPGILLGDVNVTDRIDRLLGRVSNYDVLANGTLAALNETVEMVGAGLGTVGLGISGVWTGTIVAEIEVGDGIWDVIPLVDNTLGSAALSTTVNGNFLLGVAGALTVRIRASAWAAGTATVYLEGTSAAAGVFLSRSIPTGINSVGTVGLDAGTEDIGNVLIARQVGTATATIASAASLSGEVDLNGFPLVGIIMPAAWTAANLTFQVASVSGGTFVDLYDDAGNEVEVNAAASRGLAGGQWLEKLAPWRYIKVRSGTTGTPVAQGAERVITLVLKG